MATTGGLVFFSSGIGGSCDLLLRLQVADDLLVALDHPEGCVFLVLVVEDRVAHDLVGRDRLRQLARVVERVGVEGRELVDPLGVGVGGQVLLVEIGRRGVELLALLQLGGVLLVLLPLRLAGLSTGVDVGGRRQERVLGQLLGGRQGVGVLAVVLVPVAPLGVVAAQRLALLGGRHQVPILLVGVDDPVLHLGRVDVVGPLGEQRLVDGDRVGVLRLVEVDVAQALEDLAHVLLVLAPLVEVERALEARDRIGERVAVPVGLGEADAQVLHRLGAEVGADLLPGLGARVGELDQVVELAHRLGEAVVAVVRPGELVERAVVVGRVLEGEDLAEGGDGELELVRLIEVELADAGPGLGQKLRVLADGRAALVGLVVAAGAAGGGTLGDDLQRGGGGAGGSSGLYLLAQTSARSACLACASSPISPRQKPSR